MKKLTNKIKIERIRGMEPWLGDTDQGIGYALLVEYAEEAEVESGMLGAAEALIERIEELVSELPEHEQEEFDGWLSVR